MNNKNKYIIIIFLIVGSFAVVAATALSILLGSADLSFHDVWGAVTQFDPDNMNHQIVVDLRIPRTLGTILVGASLAVSGAIMQGMTRNPIADAGLMGINQGAVFALSLCLAFIPRVNYSIITIFSFCGAAFSVFLVYGLTGLRHGKQSPVRLVLAGTAVGILLTSLSQGIALYFNVGQEVTFWTAGGTAGIRMNQILYTAPFIIIALTGSILISRPLSILSAGEENARGLGVHISRIKFACMSIVLILAGSAVALAGPISFIGLIIPHIVRGVVGVDYRKIIPFSIMTGSLFMLLADLISRLVNAPAETPVGLIFAVIGVPFFLYIARREKGLDHAG